jgi:hypothetical protein
MKYAHIHVKAKKQHWALMVQTVLSIGFLTYNAWQHNMFWAGLWVGLLAANVFILVIEMSAHAAMVSIAGFIEHVNKNANRFEMPQPEKETPKA